MAAPPRPGGWRARAGAARPQDCRRSHARNYAGTPSGPARGRHAWSEFWCPRATRAPFGKRTGLVCRSLPGPLVLRCAPRRIWPGATNAQRLLHDVAHTFTHERYESVLALRAIDQCETHRAEID